MTIERRQPAPMTEKWGEQVAKDIALFKRFLSFPESIGLLLAQMEVAPKKLVLDCEQKNHEQTIDALIAELVAMVEHFPNLGYVLETPPIIIKRQLPSDEEVEELRPGVTSYIHLVFKSKEVPTPVIPSEAKALINKYLDKNFKYIFKLVAKLAGGISNTFELPTRDLERIITSLARLEPEHMNGSLCVLQETSRVTVTPGIEPNIFLTFCIRKPDPLRPIPHHMGKSATPKPHTV